MKPLLMIAGLLFVALGFLGVFLPLLPTTPFLLLAAWCFVKSSDRLYNWLLNNRLLGPFIKTYRLHRAITLRVKISALVLLWASMLVSIFKLVPLMFVKILLLVIAIIISWVIIRVKTLKT